MTPATNERPTRRVLRSRDGSDYVVELRADLMLIRPKGTRRGGKAEIAITPGLVYIAALRKRIDEEKAAKRKSRRRARR